MEVRLRATVDEVEGLHRPQVVPGTSLLRLTVELLDTKAQSVMKKVGILERLGSVKAESD